MTVNYKDDLILITGAGGKQCANVLPRIVAKFERLRLVVNSQSSEDKLKRQYPNAEVLRADIADPKEATSLLKGVTTLFHVGPTFHFQELEIGYNMIQAAVSEKRKGNFQHFILSSVLDTQIQKMMNHDVKRYIEERLIESGLSFTILQPSIFMDAFPIPLLMSQDKPVYKANWNTDVPFSFTALRDLGEAIAKVIDEREKHYLAQYQLVSTPPITYKQAVAIVSKEIGKVIEIVDRSHEEAIAFYLDMLFGGRPVHPVTRDTTQRMLLYYNYHGLVGNPNVLGWLLARKTTSYEELARMRVAEVKAARNTTP